MGEMKAIGEALGIRFRVPLEKRIAATESRRPAQDIDAAGCRSRPRRSRPTR